jgi:hypothetical protein
MDHVGCGAGIVQQAGYVPLPPQSRTPGGRSAGRGSRGVTPTEDR